MNRTKFDHLKSLPIDEFTAECQNEVKVVDTFGKAKSRAKEATTSLNGKRPFLGKLLFAAGCHLEAAKSAGSISRDTSRARYWENLTGQKPDPKAEQCAVTFGAVDAGHLSEDAYDACSSQALERMAEIINAVINTGGDLTDERIAKAVKILEHRSDGYAKAVTAIRDEVKPRKAIKPEKVEEYVHQIDQSGFAFLAIRSLLEDLDPGMIDTTLAAAMTTKLAEVQFRPHKETTTIRQAIYTDCIRTMELIATPAEQDKWGEEYAEAGNTVDVETVEPGGPKRIAA